jgi:GT2 family glycosyltransferase
MTTCSIIIPVYNHASLTRQCLDALFRRPPKFVDTEIIVIDDASTDITSHVLGDYHGAVRVVRHERNQGFATSCNDGVATATGDLVVFLNNDMIPQPGWLDALVDYAERCPKAGIVGAKLLYPDETVQHAGIVFNRECRPLHIYVGFPAEHPAVNTSRRFQAVTGGCALMRRELFIDAGGFDTSFRNGYEDVDLCFRLAALGYECHYCHTSVLYHLESASRTGRTDEESDNAQLFDSRWGSTIRPDDWERYIEDGLVRLVYTGYKPLHLKLSPLLAVLVDEEHDQLADRLLDAHARRLFQLLRENILLNARLQDLEEEMAAYRKGHFPSPIGCPE